MRQEFDIQEASADSYEVPQDGVLVPGRDVSVNNSKEPEDHEFNYMDSIEPYKYLPLPTVTRFRQHMQTLNIKSYDDVLIYA